MIEMMALPTLQSPVDALHARLTAGHSRASGTAVKTGLTGRVTDTTLAEFNIIEQVMNGRWSATMSDIWSRDELDAAGASEDDWSLEKEATYWGIQAGLTGDTLALAVERIMRAGPYRAKWDEPRGNVSWLAQDVANAIATVQARLKKNAGPILLGLDEDKASEAPADETLEQKVARLERENRFLRSVNAVQMTIIRNERAARLAAREADEAGKRAADELVRAMFDTLAIPDEQMNARTKLVSLVLAPETVSRNSRGIFNMANITLGKMTGLSEKVVSQIMQDLAARDGTPFERIVTREWVEVSPGVKEPRSIAQVRLTIPDQTTVSVIRALPDIGGPSDKEAQRKAKSQASAAASAENKIRKEAAKRVGWGWCAEHDNDTVNVKGYCLDCGEVVGERTISVEEFRILNPEMRDSAQQLPLTVDVVTLPVQLQDSGAQTATGPPDGPQDHAMRDSAPTPIRARQPLHQRPRNGEDCLSMEYRDLGGGRLRCLGCGAETALAVMGAQV